MDEKEAMLLGRIEERLKAIEVNQALAHQERREDNEKVHGRLTKLYKEGCANAPQHPDHELRIRQVETVVTKWGVVGAFIAIVCGVVGASVTGWISRHFHWGSL